MSSELHLCSDAELARQTQAGSLTAFEELVFRYERRIYGFVLRFCPNAADAAEVTQETFVKAFRSIGSYNGRHAFAGWLFTIARHKCIDQYRAAPPQADAPMPEGTGGSDPAKDLSTQEDRDNLWAFARQVLSTAHFQGLWLAYAEDLQIKDIARVMGRTVTHVKVMLFRARRTLRRALEESRQGFFSIEPAGTRGSPARRPQGGFKKPFVAADVSRRKLGGLGLNRAPADVGGYERGRKSAPPKPASRSLLRVVRPWAFSAGPARARAAGKLGPLHTI